MKTSAIVVAAGRGIRMGMPTAKAFLEVGGQPLIVYSLRTLSDVRSLVSVVLVIPAEGRTPADDMLRRYGPWPVPIHLAIGGTERQDSVAAGLALVEAAADLVLIHDAARPFVSRSCVDACIEAARVNDAAIAAEAARDTVKLVGSSRQIAETIDRQSVWLAQTPQVFRTNLLRHAYARAAHDGVRATDDAALVERIGHAVYVVPGEPANRKITTPDDLRWAQWYARAHGLSSSVDGD